MDIIEYVVAGSFFMGVLMLVCTGLYFVIADIPGALRAVKSEEGRSILKSAKARRQASSVVKQFRQEAKTEREKKPNKKKGKKSKVPDADDIPYLETNGDTVFANLLFPESTERWPKLQVLQAYNNDQKELLNSMMQRAELREIANGICELAGGDMIEFKH